MSARTRTKEIFKSILIVLLMGLMALLFLLTWSTDASVLPDSVRGLVDGVNDLLGGTVATPPEVVGSRADTYGEAAQLRAIAVSSGSGFDGIYPPSDDLRELHERLSLVLADCLGSAEAAAEIDRGDFLSAARRRGTVMLSYTDAQPIELLALSHGVVTGIGDARIRELALVPSGLSIDVYLSDGERFLRAATAAERELLAAVTVDAHGVPSALSTDLGFAEDAPLTVYPSGELRRGVASAGPSAVGETAVNGLLAAFGMNTETNYRYVSADGTQYAVEGERTLAVSADGVVTYIADGDDGASLRADATDAAIIEFCRAILTDGSAGLIGDAELSLRSFWRDGSGATVTFGYTLAGAPIYANGSESCAVFTLDEGVLESARIALRRYALGAETALMMPPASAAVLGAAQPAYFDTGDGELIPRWSK